MPLIATAPQNQEFAPIDAGTYLARCVQVIDLGTQEIEYMGEIKHSRKVRLAFETPTETKVFKHENGEQPYLLSKEYTLSLWEKANLRADLEQWRGKSFTQEELEGFDLFTILWVPCMISVIHVQSKDGKKTYARISGIQKVMKGMECPQAINPLVKFSIEEWDDEVFNSLSDYTKEKIMTSAEWMAKANNGDFPNDFPDEPLVDITEAEALFWK